VVSIPALKWTETPTGASFSLGDDSRLLSPGTWPSHAAHVTPKTKRGITVLSALMGNDRASDIDDCAVELTARDIAGLSSVDLDALSLPPPAPYTLVIDNDGLLTDTGFAFRYKYVGSQSRNVVGARRRGAFLEVGSLLYTVQEPLFGLVDRMDAFNAEPAESTGERFRRLAELQALAPEGVELADYLSGTQVALGTAFTLDIHADGNGEVTFDPIVVRPDALGVPAPLTLESLDEEVPPAEPVASLPPAAQEAFARHFSRYRDARQQYALGDGWYLAVDEPVRKALQIVREMKEAPLAQRRAFVANPHAVLRERLADELPDEVLQSLFFEPGDYGDRVATAGLWKPKVLPFLKHAAEEWLPPETIGIAIDGQELQLSPEELPELRANVEQAMTAGKPHVEYRGRMVPATQETLGALDVIAAAANKGKREAHEKPGPIEKHVLLLEEKDNLNELVYAPAEWKSRAGAAGPPGGMRSRLKPHQTTGLEWLQRHWLDGSPGALLADDMGLGKTIQALAFLRWMQQQPGFALQRRPILIVAPTGLLANWADEHALHLDEEGLGEVTRAYGTGIRQLRHEDARRHSESATGAPVLKTKELEAASWVLTTYETLRDYAHSFGRVRWATVVLDEAQKVKNPCALMTEECKAVCSNADFVITMTGTPVENRLSELWSIVDICQPGMLRDLKSFVAQYESGQYEDTQSLRQLHAQLTQVELPAIAAPKVMLRRMKWQELRGLPRKSVREIRREMPAAQAARYTEAVAQARAKGTGQGGMLEALHGLRSISLHPGPIDFGAEDDQMIAASARLAETIEILDSVNSRGERALVFLESRALQPVLQGIIQRRYGLDRAPMLINGEVAGDKRKSMVRRFQDGSGFDVMILSPKAGGVGLTLTSANHVIHLTRWWNPAVEDQCTDRIYRIGQDRAVEVYLPIAVHPEYGEASFDERLHALLERKRELSRQVLGLAGGAASDADLQGLFRDTVGR
jgi:SNF2 family DNA or RNA helicase